MTPRPQRDRLVRAILVALIAAPASAVATADTDTRAVELDAIRVTADPLGERSVEDLARPVTVLAGPELERRQAGTIGEVLSTTPGVANADFGPGVGRPVVRGQQGSRVLMLEDGLRTADVSGEGADHAVAVDPWRAEQVEVLRGPSTLLFGSGAAGGVINVTTGRFSPLVPVGAQLDGRAQYAGNGHDRQANLAGDLPLGDRVVLRADHGWRRSNDFSIRGFQDVDQTEGFRGRLQNSDIASDSSSLSLVAGGQRGFFGAGVSRWRTDYGIPEVFDPQRERGDGSDEFERISAGYDRLDLRGELFSPLRGVQTLRLKAAHTRFDQDETGFEFSRSTGELEDTEVEARFVNRESELRIDAVLAPWAGWTGVLGISGNDRDFFAEVPDSDEEVFYVRPNRTRTAALYTLQERELGPVRVEVGARVERERSRPDDVAGAEIEAVTLADGSLLPFPERLPARRFTPVSLSAGAVGDLREGVRWRTSLGRSQRAPSPEQLYAFGRHPAAGTFEVGDPDLAMERYLSLDAGLSGRHGRLRWSLDLFHTRADNHVFLASEPDPDGGLVFVNDIGQRPGEGDTATCVPGDGGLCRFRNQFVVNTQADARFSGGEFEAGWRLTDGDVPTVLRFGADRVRGRLAGGGGLPRITPARHGIGLDTGTGPWRASLDWQRVSGQRRTAPGEAATDGFDTLSAQAAYVHEAQGSTTTVYLRGRNLTNADGRLHQSFFRDSAPITGRSLVLGVRIEYGP